MAQVFTNVGKTYILQYLLTNTFPTLYLAWGTGAGTSSATDLTLFTEDSGGSPAYARVAVTINQATTSTNLDSIVMTGSLQANAAKTITNAGIFSSLTGGQLLWKTDFPGYALNSGDSLQIAFEWAVT